MRSTGTVGQALSPPNWRAIISAGKRSMPAGTGVCVVNTVPARTASSASSKESRASVSSRMRSRPRKPAWPSLVWNTSGVGVAGDAAVGADGPHAADAEQQLLHQPVVGAAAVQAVGDVAGGGVVLGHVGVEQQQRHPADLGHPDLGVQRALARAGRCVIRTGRAVVLLEQGQRQAAGVEGRDSAPAASPRARATG